MVFINNFYFIQNVFLSKSIDVTTMWRTSILSKLYILSIGFVFEELE